MHHKRLAFHIRVNDYFATLATILDLLRQDLEKTGPHDTQLILLRRLRSELLHLQRHYRIIKVSPRDWTPT